jgi:hypothetical protein
MDRARPHARSDVLAAMALVNRTSNAVWHLLAPTTSDGQEAARILRDHTTPCVVIPASDENAPELFAGDEHFVGLEAIQAFLESLQEG